MAVMLSAAETRRLRTRPQHRKLMRDKAIDDRLSRMSDGMVLAESQQASKPGTIRYEIFEGRRTRRLA